MKSVKKVLFAIIVATISHVSVSQDYWMQLDTPDSVAIYKTEISPDGSILLGTSKGIYYSLDDGLSWIKMGDLDVGVSNIEYKTLK